MLAFSKRRADRRGGQGLGDREERHHAGDLFDESGEIKNEGAREFLTAFVVAFGAWIEKNRQSV